MASDTKRASIVPDRKRSSVQLKDGKHAMKHMLSTPSQSHSRRTPGGQMFLCVMGTVISVAICIWLAAFSREQGWRRVVFSVGAALCAVLFGFLAIMTIRRAKNPPEPEMLPDLSQRRSTIGARPSKRSIATGCSTEDQPTQVLVVGDQTRPSLTLG